MFHCLVECRFGVRYGVGAFPLWIGSSETSKGFCLFCTRALGRECLTSSRVLSSRVWVSGATLGLVSDAALAMSDSALLVSSSTLGGGASTGSQAKAKLFEWEGRRDALLRSRGGSADSDPTSQLEFLHALDCPPPSQPDALRDRVVRGHAAPVAGIQTTSVWQQPSWLCRTIPRRP